MDEPKKIVSVIKIPPAKKQCQVTIPREVSDKYRAEGITSLAVYTVGECTLLEPIR